MKRNFRETICHAVARTMPSLHHTLPGQEFSIEKSEVVRWLVSQPEIINYLTTKLASTGAIVYDNSTGTWRGADSQFLDVVTRAIEPNHPQPANE